MSAFMCSDKHIATLAVAYGRLGCLSHDSVQEIANTLRRENVKSLHYRYPSHKREWQNAPCDLTQAAVPGLSFRELQQMVACYNYQACEHPEYPASRAKAVADDMTRVFKQLADEAGLPTEIMFWHYD